MFLSFVTCITHRTTRWKGCHFTTSGSWMTALLWSTLFPTYWLLLSPTVPSDRRQAPCFELSWHTCNSCDLQRLIELEKGILKVHAANNKDGNVNQHNKSKRRKHLATGCLYWDEKVICFIVMTKKSRKWWRKPASVNINKLKNCMCFFVAT